MTRSILATLATSCLLVLAGGTCTVLAQQGLVERVGQKIDGVGRGLKQGALEITDVVRKKFEVVQTDVQRMGAHHRVYARLHWDKMLHGSNVEVHLLRDGAVLLRGVVPDAEAKQRAILLAGETEGVSGVVDELTTLVPPVEIQSARPKTRR
jgi:hyperosmotically inducible protein